jgi:hypothetical protein
MTSWSMHLAAKAGLLFLLAACRSNEAPVPEPCAQCTTDSECMDGERCEPSTRMCTSPGMCCSSKDCQGGKQCDTTILLCVEVSPSCVKTGLPCTDSATCCSLVCTVNGTCQ